MARKKKPEIAEPNAFAKQYLELLTEEGYRPSCKRGGERDDILSFKSEGTQFVLFVDGEDDNFFHLAITYALDGMAPAEALRRANELNAKAKAVKAAIFPEEQAVAFNVEAFLGGPATLPILDRSMAALRNAAESFFKSSHPAEHLDD